MAVVLFVLLVSAFAGSLAIRRTTTVRSAS
jgi:hypothetical protein